MKKGLIVVVIVACITLVVLAYMYNQRERVKSQTDMMQAQVNLINAQTEQRESCDSSWQCTTTNLLTGLSGILF